MGLFLLAFIALPLIDLFLLGHIAARAGLLPTLTLVLLSAIVGLQLARREGLRVLQRWREAVGAGRLPEEGLLSGLLVLAGGVLLVLPGVLTDVLGILLLLPPSRRGIVRLLRRRMEGAVRSGRVQVVTPRTPDVTWPDQRRGGDDVVDAEFEEERPRRPPLPQ